MATISEITWKSEAKRKARVYVDGEFWMTLPRDVIEALGLYEGREYEPSRLKLLEREVIEEKEMLYCLRSLDARMQTRRQLARKLQLREVDEEMAARILDRLDSIGLIDDEAVARQRAQTLLARGYGRRRAELKLYELGVDKDLGGKILDEVYLDDEQLERALKAMGSRFSGKDDAQKAWAFLARRGFSSDVCRKAIDQLRAE